MTFQRYGKTDRDKTKMNVCCNKIDDVQLPFYFRYTFDYHIKFKCIFLDLITFKITRLALGLQISVMRKKY